MGRRWRTSRVIQPARALNGAAMTNAQPPPLPVAGLPLPRFAELLGRPPDGSPADGSPADGNPPEPALAAGAGLAGGAGWDAIGTALVGDGAGTDETCDTCET
jgi:hypothetical protein